MLSKLARRTTPDLLRLTQVSRHFSMAQNGAPAGGHTFSSIPKSSVFTDNLPADQKFSTPASSFRASREELRPRLVRNALYTFVRPEEKSNPELVAVSAQAARDIGLSEDFLKTDEFRDVVSGNKIFWDPEKEQGIYPWAQCYGGWQFGVWAGQLGDGRAISLFETTNPETKTRYEIQLKGAGVTPYSRMADGKAVVRSSLREFLVSEALNGLRIPTTRALSLTLTPDVKALREVGMEPTAIVCRFAETWVRIGTFDLMRVRGDRIGTRKLADYVALHVFGGWDKVHHNGESTAANGAKASAGAVLAGTDKHSTDTAGPGKGTQAATGDTTVRDVRSDQSDSTSSDSTLVAESRGSHVVNRYASLYRHICLKNAPTIAKWQAYAFTNGVLNTDNTSILGLSLDFGPFAFLDDFDPDYTPNHDDHQLRYSLKNQPTVIQWNLTRLGEALGELIGAGKFVDDEKFVAEGIKAEDGPIDTEELISAAESIIMQVGEEYKAVFLDEYKRLMTLRLGLKSQEESDYQDLFSELLDVMKDNQIDYTHFFRRLSSVKLSQIASEGAREETAKRFLRKDGDHMSMGMGTPEEAITKWLATYHDRLRRDWDDSQDADAEREKAMKQVNPKFIPRGWLLDEAIQKVQREGDRDVLPKLMKLVERPFDETWEGVPEEESERWCGDVPKAGRGITCSCSS